MNKVMYLIMFVLCCTTLFIGISFYAMMTIASYQIKYYDVGYGMDRFVDILKESNFNIYTMETGFYGLGYIGYLNGIIFALSFLYISKTWSTKIRRSKYEH